MIDQSSSTGSLHYRIRSHGPVIETAGPVRPYKIQRTDHNSFSEIADGVIAMNRGLRRHPTTIITGDLPRFAMLRTRPDSVMDPDFIKLGDGRILLSVDGTSFWLDEAQDIRTAFLPHATEHRLSAPGKPEIGIVLTVTHAENRGLAATLQIQNNSAANTEAVVKILYGGLSRHGRTFTAAYFPIWESNRKAGETRITGDNGAAILTRAEFPEAVAVATWPAMPWKEESGRAVFETAIDLAPDATGEFDLIAVWAEDSRSAAAMIRKAVPHALKAEAAAYAGQLLKSASIRTPDATLDAGFACAVLEFDRVWYDPLWLEGGHWWCSPFANNYQISAAIALGQYGRARRTLEHLALAPGGGPGWGQDASRKPSRSIEALPYYIHEFWQYCEAVNDQLVPAILPALRRDVEELWKERDGNGDNLLQWRHGCNWFLYQADHLALPGSSASPTLMMAGMLDRLAILAARNGESTLAAQYVRTAADMRAKLTSRLWDSTDGAFYSHIDNQGLAHRARYYTELVFPVLYANVPVEYQKPGLDYLDRNLRLTVPSPVGGTLELLRVGELKPSIFGNDNCMPTQMAETARAYAEFGMAGEAHALLHSVALASTVFTESPGSVPERLGDDGKGEANYMFGPPIASFLLGVTEGLFGIRLEDGGRTLRAAPVLPAGWPEASISLPHCSMTVRSSKADDGQLRLAISIQQNCSRRIRLSPCLPPGRITSVTLGGRDAGYGVEKLDSATRVTVEMPPAESIEAVFCLHPESATARTIPPRMERKACPAPRILPCTTVEQIDISGLLNSKSINSTSRWAHGDPRCLKKLRSRGTVETEIGPFAVSIEETALALAEYGSCDGQTGEIRRSGYPAALTLRIRARSKALNLLFASEAGSRLTGSRVGAVTLAYESGETAEIPLIVGTNIDSLFSHYATETYSVPTGDEWDCANAWQIPCNPGQVLVDAVIRIDAADVSFALLGATINPCTEKS